ncbi:hypothetical protein ACFL15_00995 [Patescibacteria group bacterium]
MSKLDPINDNNNQAKPTDTSQQSVQPDPQASVISEPQPTESVVPVQKPVAEVPQTQPQQEPGVQVQSSVPEEGGDSGTGGGVPPTPTA